MIASQTTISSFPYGSEYGPSHLLYVFIVYKSTQLEYCFEPNVLIERMRE